MFTSPRVEVSPVGMVHIEKPGETARAQFEFQLAGLSAAESGKLKEGLTDYLRETVSEFNLGDSYRREEASNAASPVYSPR